MGRHYKFPQAPRERVVALTGRLPFPAVAPLTALAVRSKALELHLRPAPATIAASLARLSDSLADPAWTAGAGFTGLADELEPYLDDKAPDDKSEEIAKVRAEFAVYARLADRIGRIEAIGRDGFVGLLRDTHRRLGTGISTLRQRPVGITPDAAGNRVLFPHHSQCPALLGDLSDFLGRHIADYPALCATVTYGALIHCHPFNDGNGRTARTLYNLVLAAGTGSRHFVPVHLIAAHHRAAFLIKLRRAVYGGDWIGLQAFFTDAGRLSIALQLPDETASDGSTC
jgi:Fic/DOC family